MDRASTYTNSAVKPMTKPLVMWAAATCPRPNALSPIQASLLDTRRAWMKPAAPHSATAVQARVPENGIDSTVTDPQIVRASVMAPTPAAGLPNPSCRKNPYIASPAITGSTTITRPIARVQERVVKSSMGGRLNQPDWGSEAKGTPPA